MTNPSEISALKAAFRGAQQTSQALAELTARIEALDPDAEIPSADLEELSRLTAAHALASAALRGLVNTMLARRGLTEPHQRGVTEAHQRGVTEPSVTEPAQS